MYNNHPDPQKSNMSTEQLNDTTLETHESEEKITASDTPEQQSDSVKTEDSSTETALLTEQTPNSASPEEHLQSDKQPPSDQRGLSKRTRYIIIAAVIVVVLLIGNVFFLIKQGYLADILNKPQQVTRNVILNNAPTELTSNTPVTCTVTLTCDNEIHDVRTPIIVHVRGLDEQNSQINRYQAASLSSPSTQIMLALTPGVYEIAATSVLGGDMSIYQAPQPTKLTMLPTDNQVSQSSANIAFSLVKNEGVTAEQLSTIASQLSEVRELEIMGIDKSALAAAIDFATACSNHKAYLDQEIANAKAQGKQVFYGTLKSFSSEREAAYFYSNGKGDCGCTDAPKTVCAFVFDHPEDVMQYSVYDPEGKGDLHRNVAMIQVATQYAQYHNLRCVAILNHPTMSGTVVPINPIDEGATVIPLIKP